jgi:hypothetical protein
MLSRKVPRALISISVVRVHVFQRQVPRASVEYFILRPIIFPVHIRFPIHVFI